MRGAEQIPWLYDAFLAVAEALGLRRWREWLVRGARGLVLDVGCGTGRNLPFYGPEVRVIGLDPCWESLATARGRAPGVPLVLGSAQALPFAEGTFDTVVSGLVFCSVPDPRQGLIEVKRVLRPEGRLRMLEHVRSKNRWVARAQDLVQPAWTWFTGGCRNNRETEAAVEAAGFEIEDDGRRARRELRRFSARPTRH